jgi:glycosyltransferase involved in cell wall biosynthesis
LLPVPFQMAGPVKSPDGDIIEIRHAHPVGSLSELELARWLAAKPVFASAARYEPFGLAVLEAAQAGCALVLADIPTLRELWDGAAVFVDPLDHQGFAREIGEIVGDSFAREQLGRAAQERAERYSVSAMARRMAGLYRDLASARAARVAA